MATITLSPEELNASLDRFLGNPAAPEFIGPALSHPPFSVDWAENNIQPPTNLFIAPEDHLVFQVLSPVAGGDVRCTGVMLLENGRVSAFERAIITTGAVSFDSLIFNPGTGFLLHLAVWVATGATKPGLLYVQLGVRHDLTPPVVIDNQLIAGYPQDAYSLQWPIGVQSPPRSGHGNARSITVADPAAGAAAISTSPITIMRRVHAGSITLTTSAAAANRQVFVQIDNGTNVLFRGTADNNQVASTALLYSFGNCGYTQPAPNSGVVGIGIPPIALFSGYRILITAVNLQAGDQFSGLSLAVEDWTIP
jgi:hypothetical protein